MTQLEKLQGLLDGLVAAGRPGPAGPWRPGCASGPEA
jgi:hypothetical protein